MMTSNQTQSIEIFLRSKYVPTDYLPELMDHISAQIFEMMAKQHLNFDEAFLQAKLTWKYDLKPVKAGVFSSKKVPLMVKKDQNALKKKWKMKACKTGLLATLLSFLLCLTFENYISVPIISVIGLYIGLRQWRSIFEIAFFWKANQNTRANIYRRSTLLSIFFSLFLLYNINLFDDSIRYINQMGENFSTNIELAIYALVLIFIHVAFSQYVYLVANDLKQSNKNIISN